MKTLWGLEPFHQDKAKIQTMYSLIRQFSPNDQEIDIGFIATRDIQALNLAFDVPASERYSKFPHRIIVKNLLKAKIPLHEQNIIVNDIDTISTTTAVQAFLDLAKKQKSELLAIFTQDKKDFVKFTLGSFAETATELSPKNLLIVSPNVKPIKKITSFLYASDFHEKNKGDILEMLEMSLLLKSKIVIYHHSLDIARYKKDKKDPDNVKSKKRIDDFCKWIQEQARVKKAKVKIITEGSFNSVSESIIATAKKEKVHLIAVTAKTSKLKSIFVGSTTKQVLRYSEVPVLVLKN